MSIVRKYGMKKAYARSKQADVYRSGHQWHLAHVSIVSLLHSRFQIKARGMPDAPRNAGLHSTRPYALGIREDLYSNLIENTIITSTLGTTRGGEQENY
jgi:hypothetical protein